MFGRPSRELADGVGDERRERKRKERLRAANKGHGIGRETTEDPAGPDKEEMELNTENSETEGRRDPGQSQERRGQELEDKLTDDHGETITEKTGEDHADDRAFMPRPPVGDSPSSKEGEESAASSGYAYLCSRVPGLSLIHI